MGVGRERNRDIGRKRQRQKQRDVKKSVSKRKERSRGRGTGNMNHMPGLNNISDITQSIFYFLRACLNMWTDSDKASAMGGKL